MNKSRYKECRPTPFFSVIIPTRNRSKLLKESINSVLSQTFKDFEVIAVDDHSIDDTEDVVNSFQDPRVKYIINDRKSGGAGARNAGIFKAKGNWVAFLDDDDVWLPQKLELKFWKIKELDELVGLIYAGFARYDFDNKKVISIYMPQEEGWIQKDLLYKNCIGTLSTVAIRRDLLKKVGGLDERFEALQDRELYVRIAALTKVAFIKQVLVYYRLSSNDRISLNFENKLNGNLLFWKKYKKLINRSPKLCHRAASSVFIYAFLQRKWKIIFHSIPWTLGGIFFDIKNFVEILKLIAINVKKNYWLKSLKF
jgi:glycosyltransferase involved in cell wall biosynthesis